MAAHERSRSSATPSSTQDDFISRIQVARGARGLTVEALANLTGLSATAITDIENGRVKRPRVQTVTALARVLGLDAGELLTLLRTKEEVA